jgi:hypothetical protein
MALTVSSTELRTASEQSALARRAASAHATALCDEIDRRHHDLIGLRAQLEGAIAVCRALGEDGCEREDLAAIARAERIRSRMSG